MRDLVVGVAAGNLSDTVVLDLDDAEDKYGQGDLPIAVLPNLDEIVLLQSDGTFNPKQYKEALDLMMPACKKIYELQRKALTKKYSRITKEVSESLEDDNDKQPEAEKTETKKEAKPKAEKAKKDEKTSAKEDPKKAKKADADKKKKPSKKTDKKDDAKKSSPKKEQKK
jgi:type IV secretory pathway VirB10-like protein